MVPWWIGMQICLVHTKAEFTRNGAIAGRGDTIESETWFDRQSGTDQTEKHTEYIGVAKHQNRRHTINVTQRLSLDEQRKWRRQ